MSERLKEHAWNACKVQAFEGSNPSLSAILKMPFKNATSAKQKQKTPFKQAAPFRR